MGPCSLPYQGPQDPTYSTMGPLPATYSPPPPDMPSPMAPLNHSIPGLHHSLPPPLSPLPEPMGADLYHVASPPSPWQHFTTHQVQVHDPAATRTFSTNEGSLPRPTAMVHPLPTPMEEDHHPTDLHLPFANERTGTIKLKTSPTEAFARLQAEGACNNIETETKEPERAGNSSNSSLLKTPTRSGNRTAGDVMDDISTMLADLTDELDSMLCSDSVPQ